MGHSNPITTLGIYTQSNLKEDRKIVDEIENAFYNTYGLSISDLYKICVDRFSRPKKIIDVLEKATDQLVTDENYYDVLHKFKNHLMDIYPAFAKISKIDSELSDDDIEAIFVGYTPIYKTIKIDFPDMDLLIKI
ncbi:MAG: hypothetical protein ACK5HP_03785 [Bacilli bacterium]